MTNYPIPHFVTRSIPHIKNPIPIDFSENNRNGARKLYTQKRYHAYQAGSRDDPTILRTKKQSVKHNGTPPHPLSTYPCPANRGHPHTNKNTTVSPLLKVRQQKHTTIFLSHLRTTVLHETRNWCDFQRGHNRIEARPGPFVIIWSRARSKLVSTHLPGYTLDV